MRPGEHTEVPMPTTADELLSVAVEVARAAADLARDLREHGVTGVATKSTATDVVTAADKATERLVIDALHERRPGDAVLGEESGESTGVGAVRWILDPIDGTVNYLYGLPQYAVSLAAEVDGTIVAGVVRNAATGEEWTATRGGGAYRAGRRLGGSATTELSQTLLATGFGYAATRRAHQAQVLARVLPLVRDIRRFGAAPPDLGFAAEGRVDAYFEKGLNLWDHAAGGLVAAAAGPPVTGLARAPPRPDLGLAAPPALPAPLHDALVAFDAAGGP